MPAFQEMSKFREENNEAHRDWYWALQECYKNGPAEVVEWADSIPAVVVSKWVTAACLLHMGYGPTNVRNMVKLEFVKRRLS